MSKSTMNGTVTERIPLHRTQVDGRPFTVQPVNRSKLIREMFEKHGRDTLAGEIVRRCRELGVTVTQNLVHGVRKRMRKGGKRKVQTGVSRSRPPANDTRATFRLALDLVQRLGGVAEVQGYLAQLTAVGAV